MVALDASFMEQEVERCERLGMRSRSDVSRLRYWQDRARAAKAAQPKTAPTFAAPMSAGRPANAIAAPNVAGVRETPGRPAEPDQLVLGDDCGQSSVGEAA